MNLEVWEAFLGKRRMLATLPRTARPMPNFRRGVIYDEQGFSLRVSAFPMGWRGGKIRGRLFGWWPLITGSKVQVRLRIEADPSPERVFCTLFSDVESKPRRELFAEQNIKLPYDYTGPEEYISAPGEYLYTLLLLGTPQTIVDFSALSKDRFLWGIVLALSVVVVSATLSLLVKLFA